MKLPCSAGGKSCWEVCCRPKALLRCMQLDVHVGAVAEACEDLVLMGAWVLSCRSRLAQGPVTSHGELAHVARNLVCSMGAAVMEVGEESCARLGGHACMLLGKGAMHEEKTAGAVAGVGKENCPPRSDAGLAEAGHCWAGLLVGLKRGLNCS